MKNTSKCECVTIANADCSLLGLSVPPSMKIVDKGYLFITVGNVFITVVLYSTPSMLSTQKRNTVGYTVVSEGEFPFEYSDREDRLTRRAIKQAGVKGLEV